MPSKPFFFELVPGDRFKLRGDLYTKLTETTARLHSRRSLGVGDGGYGYSADDIDEIIGSEQVEFAPPAGVPFSAVDSQQLRKCLYCEQRMLAGSECTSASQAGECAMRADVKRG